MGKLYCILTCRLSWDRERHLDSLESQVNQYQRHGTKHLVWVYTKSKINNFMCTRIAINLGKTEIFKMSFLI